MKVSRKSITLFILFGLIILITFMLNIIFKLKNYETQIAAYSTGKITWEEYQSSFDYAVDNFSVEGLSVKASTKGGNITAVDVYDVLNNRPFLTLDGKFDSSNLTPTEEQIIIEDQDQNIQITIAFIYTENYGGYDILTYPSNAGFGTLNEELVKKSTFVIGSYNNLIFSVNQIAAEKFDANYMDQTIIEFVGLINDYFEAQTN